MFTDMANQMLGYDVPNSYDLIGSRPAQELDLSVRSNFESFLAELPEQIEETIGSFHAR
jgi:hypothetical protein